MRAIDRGKLVAFDADESGYVIKVVNGRYRVRLPGKTEFSQAFGTLDEALEYVMQREPS